MRCEHCNADVLTSSDLAQCAPWRPIETAPKNGSRMLVWWNNEPVITYWAERIGFAGWQPPAMVAINVSNKASWKPTHWMPLPTDPALTSTERCDGADDLEHLDGMLDDRERG